MPPRGSWRARACSTSAARPATATPVTATACSPSCCPVRPRNYHADSFKWGTSWEQIERTVRLGRSDVMPSFAGALSESEIRSVALLVACWVAQREPAE